MQNDSNKKDVVQQALDVVNDKIREDDYLKLFDLLERIHGSLRIMPRWVKKQYADLNGVDFNKMQSVIKSTLDAVDSPYEDDNGDTFTPGELV